eukprot:1628521-Pleurochrysis_carterae.AAC.3
MQMDVGLATAVAASLESNHAFTSLCEGLQTACCVERAQYAGAGQGCDRLAVLCLESTYFVAIASRISSGNLRSRARLV